VIVKLTMASGMGLKGNTGRCFRYFEEFAVCMVSKYLYKNMMMMILMISMMIRMMLMIIKLFIVDDSNDDDDAAGYDDDDVDMMMMMMIIYYHSYCYIFYMIIDGSLRILYVNYHMSHVSPHYLLLTYIHTCIHTYIHTYTSIIIHSSYHHLNTHT
jgi:hypothetical protein